MVSAVPGSCCRTLCDRGTRDDATTSVACDAVRTVRARVLTPPSLVAFEGLVLECVPAPHDRRGT